MKPEIRLYNADCVEGARKLVADGSVDLIITDPPYGISGHNMHRHYHRDEGRVIGGYEEVPLSRYAEFSAAWVREAERVLKPGGSIYIVSGYTNLYHILHALRGTSLQETNHIIWKYNFGVFTSKKYVSSHYHILYYSKPGAPRKFNAYCRFGAAEKDAEGGAANYLDREDVWVINREFKHFRARNKNELPLQLLMKMIQYSSDEGDCVCDFFLGGFSTAKAAIGMNRGALGFEINRESFVHHLGQVENLEPGYLLKEIGPVEDSLPGNRWKRWTAAEKKALAGRYLELIEGNFTKRRAIEALSAEFGRGYFAVLNAIGRFGMRKIGRYK